MNDSIRQFLDSAYEQAMTKASGQKIISSSLPQELKDLLDCVLDYAETAKAVMTVVMTSLVYKYLNPAQDIRKHQQSIEGGYSGRTFDSKYITPFLKEKKFPAMAESGWLTRSLEQKVPYDCNYTGAITPKKLKSAFLNILDYTENNIGDAQAMLDYLLQGLIIIRDSHNILLARPQNLTITSIIHLLDLHFHTKYKAEGASRLPVLAIYAIYECIIGELRYKNKELLPLESHTSADTRSGRIADIDIVYTNTQQTCEAIEVKFDIPINHNIVETAIEKIQPVPTVERYYILSTSPIAEVDKNTIETDIQRVKNTHGCQLIINGILPTLKYYLRLVDDTGIFINRYVDLLETDEAVKFEHKTTWNNLISKI